MKAQPVHDVPPVLKTAYMFQAETAMFDAPIASNHLQKLQALELCIRRHLPCRFVSHLSCEVIRIDLGR